MANRALRNFILEQIERRNMGVREFAQFVGVSQTTINRFLDEDNQETRYPSIDFIVKLANATKTDPGTLVSLIEPDVYRASSEVDVIAEDIQQLTEQQRRIVKYVIRGILQEANE